MRSKAFIFILASVVCGVVYGKEHKRPYRQTQPNDTVKCDVTPIEGRLQQLEAHVDQKVETLRRDLWSRSRNMEQQTSSLRNLVEQLKNDLTTTDSGRTRRNFNQLQPNEAPDLERQIQVVIATLRLLSTDLAEIKQNLSNIDSALKSVTEKNNVDQNIQTIFAKPQSSIPASCQEIKEKNYAATSSVYLIQPIASEKPFLTYCDMDTRDGGWLTIQNRFLGDQDFYRDWQDYKVGFGNVAAEHWLGLERIYQLTGNSIHELLINLVDVDNNQRYAYYSHFSVGSEEEGYSLKVLGGYGGDAGDSLSYHAGSKFSTKDKDQDSWGEGNCAQSHGGAWWYKSCDKSNLNGRYLPGPQPDLLMYQPMYWDSFGGSQRGLKYARMMIRPRKESGILSI